ncbi:MAG TPA: TIR domain-containing protein [Anaerolineae bacterium]|nr:TIR domain-containing protein [Anaerolineae bacterium]
MTDRVEFAYDLFISYAEAERAWVEGYLLDALTQAGVRCHTEAAFALGVPRLLEFERAVQDSRRTLLVLSPAYLAEGFTQFTDLLAQSYGLESATWPVIPLILRPVELPPRLALLTALDATDPDDWPPTITRLCTELQRAAPGPAPRPVCPYPGMVPFSEEDSERFFGREREAQELLERLRLHPFLAVIGPSGSGKSSLVFAGLIPALRKSGLFGPGGWLVRALRPGEAPLAALQEAIGDVTNLQLPTSNLQPPTSNLLLVVDQFEELFTLARADVEAFQQALLRLAESKSTDQETDKRIANCRVVLTVRADFYPDLMATLLWPEIQAHRAEVLPLGEDGLRQAIVRPAENAGVFVESALVERLVADAAGEPGVLPLVQEALVLLWERLERRFLPLSAYEALGSAGRTGLQVAMARRADAVLADLTPEQQAIARRTFLRLVQFGEGRADTRRQQPVADLRAAGDAPEAFEHTLEHLAHNRLLTLSGEERAAGRQADIAHEALIAGWPTLQTWLSQRREAEQTRRRLEATAAEWERLGRGSGGLLDEVELAEAERWLASPDASILGYSETLPALAQTSRMVQRRNARLRLGALSTIAVLIIAVLLVIAVSQGRLAEQERTAAATSQAYAESQATARAEAEARREEAVSAQGTAEAERKRADQQAHIAFSRQLAAQALTQSDQQLDLSLLLSLEACRAANTFEARSSLLTGLEYHPRLATFLHDPGKSFQEIAFGPHGTVLAWSSYTGTLTLWDATTGQRISELPGHPPMGLPGDVASVAFSPDGKMWALGKWDNTIILWDVETGQPLGQPLTGHAGWAQNMAFSPDGKVLASSDYLGTLMLWDIATWQPIGQPLAEHTGGVGSMTFSPDGSILAAGSWVTITLWDVATGQPLEPPLIEHSSAIRSLAFSPGGETLVVGHDVGAVRLWDVATRQPISIRIAAHADDVISMAFSPDSKMLASAGQDGTVMLWDWDTVADQPVWDWKQPVRQSLTGHEFAVGDLAFSPDSTVLATAGWNAAMLWDVTTDYPMGQVLTDSVDTVQTMAFSPDGRTLVSGSCVPMLWGICERGEMRFWDVVTRQPLGGPLASETGGVLSLAYSQDGKVVAAGCANGTIMLWDAAARQPTGAPLTGHDLWVTSVAFSPDGQTLASGGCRGTAIAEGGCNEGEIRLWDVASGKLLGNPLTGHAWAVERLVFSPDGRTLASSGGDTTILWDVATREPLGEPFPGGAPIDMILSPDERVPAWLLPDSQLLASNVAAGITLWDVEAGQPLGQPLGSYPAMSLALSSDGQMLASSHGVASRSAIVLWDLRLESWIARACRVANRNLTQAEWEQFMGQGVSYACTCPDLPPGEGAPPDACTSTH